MNQCVLPLISPLIADDETEKFIKGLVGRTDVEDALARLDCRDTAASTAHGEHAPVLAGNCPDVSRFSFRQRIADTHTISLNRFSADSVMAAH